MVGDNCIWKCYQPFLHIKLQEIMFMCLQIIEQKQTKQTNLLTKNRNQTTNHLEEEVRRDVRGNLWMNMKN